MPTRTDLNLSVDLQNGVVPISTAASSLAALIKRAGATSQPVIITQKGYPTGVLLPIGLFTALKGLAADQEGEAAPAPNADELILDVLPTVEAEPEAPRPAARRRKRAETAPTEAIA
ncbi:MAG: type II toxin-antitoxin system Phd/YefM family antitoxin [Chloroflexales bacterium]